MGKSRYQIVKFPSCDLKNALAKLSEHVLEKVEYFHELLQTFTHVSTVPSPQRILHYMTVRSNENIFNPGLSRLSTSCEIGSSSESSSSESSSSESSSSESSSSESSSTESSSLESSSPESSSPVKGESISSSLTRKQLAFGTTKDDSEPANLETKTIISGNQESVESCEKAEMFSGSDEDVKMKSNPKVKMNVMEESEENIHDLMKRNLVKITSMSIIRQLEGVGVEIDIDMIHNLSESSSEKLGQDAGASEIASSPDKSPSSGPSKLGESTHGPSKANVDFSNPETLQFMAKGLSNIMWYRKTYIKRTYKCFLKSQLDARNFYNTICNMKFVVKYFPIENEKYFTEDLVKMRSNLMKKSNEMLKKVHPMVQELDDDVDGWAECVKQIYDLEEKCALPLSKNNVALKNLELMLKKMCSKLYDTMIWGDGRKAILIKSSSDFEWLVKHFVKFLIITGILTPFPSLSSEDVKEN